jgi:hypothetical protein
MHGLFLIGHALLLLFNTVDVLLKYGLLNLISKLNELQPTPVGLHPFAFPAVVPPTMAQQ